MGVFYHSLCMVTSRSQDCWLRGCVVTLGTVPVSEKSRLNSTVRKYGGTTSTFLTSTTTHYLTDSWDRKANETDPRYQYVLSTSYLDDCVTSGCRIIEELYALRPSGHENSPSERAVVSSLCGNAIHRIASLQKGMEAFQSEEAVVVSPRFRSDIASKFFSRDLLEEFISSSSEDVDDMKSDESPRVTSDEAQPLEVPEEQWSCLSFPPELSTDLPDLFPSFGETSTDLDAGGPSSLRRAPPVPWQSVIVKPAQEEAVDLVLKQERIQRNHEEFELAQRRREQRKAQLREQRIKKKAQVEKGRKKNALKGKKESLKRKREAVQKREEEHDKAHRKRQADQAKWNAEQERRRAEWKVQWRERKQKARADLTRIRGEDAEEKGRKLFIGKISFDDILNDPSTNEFSRETLMNERIDHLKEMLESFGSVAKFKHTPRANFLFVVYDSETSAEEAYAVFSDYESKKRLVASMRKRLKESLSDVRFAPLPTFYARWPRRDRRPQPVREEEVMEDEEGDNPDADEAMEDGWERSS